MEFCFKHFGKRFKELNQEEKTEFFKLQKRMSREKHPEYKEKDRFYYHNNKEKCMSLSKRWQEKHQERCKELSNKHNRIRREKSYKERGYGCHEGNWTFRTFGKRYKDMTEEEKVIRKRIYNKTKKNRE